MAFTFTKTNESVAGDIRITMGTFTSASGSTGGDSLVNDLLLMGG